MGIVVIRFLYMIFCLVNVSVIGAAIKGSQHVVERKIELSNPIDDVSIYDIGELRIVRGDSNQLVIRAEDNLQPYLKQEFSGKSRLKLEVVGSIQPKCGIIYILTLKDLPKKLMADGSSSIVAESMDRLESLVVDGSSEAHLKKIGKAKKGEIRFQLDGSASIEIGSVEGVKVYVNADGAADLQVGNLNASNLDINSDGSSKIRIEGGLVENQSIACDGASTYNSKALKSVNSDVRMNGASKAYVLVEKVVDGKLKGASHLMLYGDCKKINIQTSGSAYYKSR